MFRRRLIMPPTSFTRIHGGPGIWTDAAFVLATRWTGLQANIEKATDFPLLTTLTELLPVPRAFMKYYELSLVTLSLKRK